MRLTAAVTKEDRHFVAQCLEVDVASQGPTMDDALQNLRQALELHFQDGVGDVRPSPIIAPLEVDVPSAE